jgi:hypothetical protein
MLPTQDGHLMSQSNEFESNEARLRVRNESREPTAAEVRSCPRRYGQGTRNATLARRFRFLRRHTASVTMAISCLRRLLDNRDNHIFIAAHSQLGGLRTCSCKGELPKAYLFARRGVGSPDVVVVGLSVVRHVRIISWKNTPYGQKTETAEKPVSWAASVRD